jgi:hypothetical protein
MVDIVVVDEDGELVGPAPPDAPAPPVVLSSPPHAGVIATEAPSTTIEAQTK